MERIEKIKNEEEVDGIDLGFLNPEDIVDHKHTCYSFCSMLVNLGADKKHACNYIAPRNDNKPSNRRREMAKSGKLDVAMGLFTDNPDSIDYEQVTIHSSNRTHCIVMKEQLFMLLCTALRFAELAWARKAYKFGVKNMCMDPLGTSYKQEVLFPCPCIHGDISVSKKPYDPHNPQASLHPPCRKLIYAEDPDMLAKLNADQLAEWRQLIKVKKAQLYQLRYGSKSVDICPQCENGTINMAYVDASERQLPYRSDSKIKCASCDYVWCRVCKDAYHHYTPCPGPPRNNLLTEMIEDAESEEKKMEIINKFKPCPVCMTTIEKIAGCAHMKCEVCHSHICWNCMATLHPGDPYGHRCSYHGPAVDEVGNVYREPGVFPELEHLMDPEELARSIPPQPNIRWLSGIPFGGQRAPKQVTF